MKVCICKCVFILCLYLLINKADAQEQKSLFKWFGPHEKSGFSFTSPPRFYEVLCTKAGTIKITSTLGVWSGSGVDFELNFYIIGKDKTKFRAYNNEDGIRNMYESPEQIVFFATHDNKIFWQPNDQGGVGPPPFIFPPMQQTQTGISKIWIDEESNMFIGTYNDNFYFINEGAKFSDFEGGMDSVGNFYIKKGAKLIKKIVLGSNIGIYSFINDPIDKKGIWIGTNKGLFFYRKDQEKATSILSDNFSAGITITHLEVDEKRNIWFSTLEKGMGFYDSFLKTCQFFQYDKKKQNGSSIDYPIKTFCRKSSKEFFIANLDSVPSIFNTESKTYSFMQDSIFRKTEDSTTDIKLDGFGNLFVIKGGGLYYSNAFKENKEFAVVKLDSSAFAPFIRNIEISGEYYGGGIIRNIKEISLKHFENKIKIQFSLTEFWDADNVQFAWKAEGYMNEWIEMPIKGEETGFAFLGPLDPGKYIFRVKAKAGNENWRKQEVKLVIIVEPPFWLTWWFWTIVIAGVSILLFVIVKWRVSSVRKRERLKNNHEKEVLELEAKALRAQMNPHFIFNCLNSIKSLIQDHEEEKSVTYLTTFSKLIRTLFNNADKKEISLYDEIETCKFYLQLETMRFDAKFSFFVNVDENIDLKSIKVPALIIQPFIENAIWHGIVPKETGGRVEVIVTQVNDIIEVSIDDNGIGREASRQNKSASGIAHQSKGVNLTQSRLDLENRLNETNARLETIDKKDDNGHSAGTRVILTIASY